MSGIATPMLAAATLAGGILGAIYALSPLTVWFWVVIAGLVAWAVHGLPERERRWVLAVLAVAIASRVLVIAALFLMRDPDVQYYSSFFFDGDGKAMKLRSLWIAEFWAGRRVDPFESYGGFSNYGWSTYLYVVAYLQYVFGPAPYGIHLFNIALYVAGAVVLYRFVRPLYGRLTALVGLALVLFLPTLFLWSISALKESLQFFLMAVTLVGALAALRQPAWEKRLAAAAASIAALAALTTVRAGGLQMVTAAVSLGVIGAIVARRRYVLIAVVVILAAGGWYGARQQPVQSRILAELQRPASLHMGNVRTEGHAYRLLDMRFYANPNSGEQLASLTWPEGVRFIVRGLASFVLVPLPWDVTSRSELVFLPAQVMWYGAFFLACVGLLPGIQRDALLTLTLAAYGLVGAAIVTLNNGNVGTLVRHRDLVVPFLAWLSALGGVSMLRWLARRHGAHSPGTVAPPPPDRSIVRASALESSLIVQWLKRLTGESRLCRLVIGLLTRRNTSIDAGIPRDEEALVLGYLVTQARRSRLFDLPSRWLPRQAAWRDAATVRFLLQLFGALSTPQRVQLLGLVIAVAVSVEALVARAGSATAGPFDLGMQVSLVALALVFLTGSRPLAAAWESKRRSSSRVPDGAGSGRQPALVGGQ